MKISELQWTVFRYRNQEHKSWPEVSELTGMEIQEARKLLDDLRESEPELFPPETERYNLGIQLTHKERVDYNAKVINTNDINEAEVEQKF